MGRVIAGPRRRYASSATAVRSNLPIAMKEAIHVSYFSLGEEELVLVGIL